MTYEEFTNAYSKKTYIGDGAYVSFDGYHFIISTERDNGVHWIGLEPPVFDALIKFRERVYEDAKKIEN